MRILLYTMAILLLIMPAINADETTAPNEQEPTPYVTAPPCIDPKLADEGMLDIDFEAVSAEVEIGSEFYFNVFITNPTDNEASVYSVHITDLLPDSMESADNNLLPSIDNCYLINQGETIELKLKGQLSDEFFTDGRFYKEGDDFYLEYTLGVGVEFNKGDHYLYFEHDLPAVKITNIYDISEYLEIEWLDNRENMYIFQTYFIYDNDLDEDINMANAQVYFKMSLTNNSPVTIETWGEHGIIFKREEAIIYDEFYIWRMNRENLEDTIDQKITKWFSDGDKYYYYECIKTYNLLTYTPPNVDIMLSSNESETSTAYKLQVKNNEENTIENLVIMMRPNVILESENYLEVFEIEPDEIIMSEYTIDKQYALGDIYIGYILDGMVFATAIYDINSYSDFKTAEYSDWCQYHSEYEYYDEKMKQNTEHISAPAPTPEQEEIITPSPNKEKLFKQKVIDNLNKRETIRIWTLNAIGVLMIGAVVVIVRSIKKIRKNKDKQNEE